MLKNHLKKFVLKFKNWSHMVLTVHIGLTWSSPSTLVHKIEDQKKLGPHHGQAFVGPKKFTLL